MHRSTAIIITISVAAAAIIAIFFTPPIAQDIAYHNFADKRPFLGVVNFGDVVGNVFFTIVGIMGLRYVSTSPQQFTMPGEQVIWVVFFLGAAAVGFGSTWYHLNPNNQTLVWDRIPMAVAFMSFFTAIIMERIGPRTGLWLATPLLVAGIGSVLYWSYTESIGQGDMRAYGLVQFLPVVLIPLMVWLFPPRYTAVRYIGYTFGWYAVAKLLEYFDDEVFALLAGTVSGHTLKHLAAAMGVFMMLSYIRQRKSV